MYRFLVWLWYMLTGPVQVLLWALFPLKAPNSVDMDPTHKDWGHFTSPWKPKLVAFHRWKFGQHCHWEGLYTFHSVTFQWQGIAPSPGVEPGGYALVREKRPALQMYWGLKIDRVRDDGTYDYVYRPKEQSSLRIHRAGWPVINDMAGS